MGDDHGDRQLDSLAPMDRARVGQAQALGLLGREAEHLSVVGAEEQRALVVLAALRLVEQAEQRPVHQAEVVQVASGHHQLVADAQPAAADRLAVGVQPRAQRLVERVDAELAAIDGREHLDVGDRVDVVVRGKALADERDDLLASGGGVGSLDQEQVAAHGVCRGEGGGLAAADRVGALHDHAPGRLAEDVGQPGCRHAARGDQLGERLAGADRRELVGVADEHHVRLRADRAQERDEQLEVGHRGLVDDQQVAAQRIVLVVGRALARDPAERRVDRRGVHPAGLAHADRGATGRRDQQHSRVARGRHLGDRADRRGLAGAGPAGDQRQAVRDRVSDSLELLLGEAVGLAGLWAIVREAVAGLARDQLLDAARQLGLELGGLRAVDPALLAGEIAVFYQLVDVGLGGVCLGAEQLVRGGEEQVQRHAGAAAALGLRQRVEDRRARALGAVGGACRACGRSGPRSRNPTPNTLVSSYGRSDTRRWAPSPYVSRIREAR